MSTRVGGKLCRILKTTKTLAFTLIEMGSHWGVPSRRGTWMDFHFNGITLAVRGKIGLKAEGGEWR